MTKLEINAIIAKACVTADKYVLMKRGLYWRKNAQGYTSNVAEAWLLSEKEADQYVYPYDEPVTKHRAPFPEYADDLNAMHEAEKTLSNVRPPKTPENPNPLSEIELYRLNLCIECLMDGGPICASAYKRSIAFIKTKML